MSLFKQTSPGLCMLSADIWRVLHTQVTQGATYSTTTCIPDNVFSIWQSSKKKSLWSGTAPSRIHQLRGTGGSTLPRIKDVDKGSADVGPDRVYLLTYGGTTQTSSPLCVLQYLLLQVSQTSYNLNSDFFLNALMHFHNKQCVFSSKLVLHSCPNTQHPSFSPPFNQNRS